MHIEFTLTGDAKHAFERLHEEIENREGSEVDKNDLAKKALVNEYVIPEYAALMKETANRSTVIEGELPTEAEPPE